MNRTSTALFLSTLLLGTAELAFAGAEPQNPPSSRPQVGHSERHDTSPNLRDMPPLPERPGPPCEMPLGRISPPGEREKKIPPRPGPGTVMPHAHNTPMTPAPKAETR